ncbi:MAG: hypothetical protein WC627_05200 [Legionella sp.]|jgi:hypothetical protein
MKKIPNLSVALTLMTLLSCGSANAAANFKFSVIGTLPHYIPAGGDTSVLIKVTNTTQGALSGYMVRCLSESVVVDSSSGYCSNPLYLPAGQSCILKLDISGPVASTFDLCNGIACTTSGINLNITEKNNVAGIAAGVYETTDFFNSHLLAYSLGGTNPWAYAIDYSVISSALPNYKSGAFYTSSCSSSNCLAAGFYFDTVPSEHLLFANSTSGGSTWTYLTTQPGDYISGEFVTGAYQGTNAVVAGTYYNGSVYTLLLEITTDSGSSLSVVSPPAGVTDFSSGYNGTTCTNSFCAAAGFYTTTNGQFLLVGKSTGFSTTWTYPVSDGLGQPGDLDASKGNRLAGISCSSSVCATAGFYYSTTQVSGAAYPILGESPNANAWTYPINSTTDLPTDFNTTTPDGVFTAVSCNGNVCAAIGQYFNTDSEYVPLFAVRSSAISGWNYPNITPLFPAGLTEINLTSVSCSASTCVIAANGFDEIGNRIPFVLYSLNGGVSWNYPATISQYPADFIDGIFNSVNCNGLSCLAAGGYYAGINPGFIHFLPFLAESSDGGVTWIYAVNSVTPQLPSDLDQGQFNSTSVSTSTYLSKSLRFLESNSGPKIPLSPHRVWNN